MNKEYGYTEAFLNYRSFQNKFDYFFLGVILASLSLSVQAFDSKTDTGSFHLLLITWFLLLISFLAGFFRQERISIAYKIEVDELRIKSRKDFFEQANLEPQIVSKPSGSVWTKEEITNELSRLNEFLLVADKYFKEIISHSNKAYQVQKWSYFYAVLFYIFYKVTNVFFISIFYELGTILLVALFTVLLAHFYKKTITSLKYRD